MKPEQLGVGVKVWVMRRYEYDEIADYVDGPFLVVAFDSKMAYVVRGYVYYEDEEQERMESGGDGQFFKVEILFESREAAKGSLEEKNKDG